MPKPMTDEDYVAAEEHGWGWEASMKENSGRRLAHGIETTEEIAMERVDLWLVDQGYTLLED